jgi:arginyl-tRNA synthetase
MTSETYILEQLNKYLENHKLEKIPITLQKPKEEKHGDYSSNLAMQLAKNLKKSPRDIADEIIRFFPEAPQYIKKIELAGPGFINFFISNAFLFDELKNILVHTSNYGRTDLNTGKKAQIEFVSANPTGPLTIGHGRGAVLGDSIARLLEATGYEVIREYYYNDAGRQMRVLGDSTRLRYLELLGEDIEFPEDYYQGEYIIDIARSIFQEQGDKQKQNHDVDYFKEKAEQAIFSQIRSTIDRLGFKFDVFYNEKSLYDEGKIDSTIEGLREKGLIEERDGAIWFRTSKVGFEQDRVIVKSTGEPTYRLPDTAYHVEKMLRGFDLVIDIFGADHIATYPDVLAGVKALGYDVSKIKVLIHQFVTLTEGGEKVKMSTRKANFITLDELMDDVGVDVTRYFFLMRHMNSHLNFDLALARTQSDENPVFYIQYAHARICSIISLAESKNLRTDEPPNLTNLDSIEELNLIKHLVEYPATVSSSAENMEPHRLINYLYELANLFHKFYTERRVISDNLDLSISRIALINATRVIIANGLNLLGISAPERM